MRIKDALRTLRFICTNKNHNRLYTTWGEELDPKHLLQEYPRPQLRRDNYTNLNGYWKYAITKKKEYPKKYDGKILVPFSPESILSGVNKSLKPREVLWYKRELKVKHKPEGQRCILHFGAVDQFCEVYINQKKVTEHMGGYLPFSVDITTELRTGKNQIVVKVIDKSDKSYHSRGKQKRKRGGMFYTAQSGIWQTVWMEWVPNCYIKNIKINPKVDESSVSVAVHLDTNGIDTTHPQDIMVHIYDNDELIHAATSQEKVISITLGSLKLWSPEQPHLYKMKIVAGEDSVDSYFAMRKYEVIQGEDGLPRIYLNGKPYFQNGLLDQGYWPDGLYTAPSDEAMIYDIEKAKELGFHMLRKHCKIEPLRWYYHCDRLGMIVWQDIVNGGGYYNKLIVGYLPTLFPKLKLKDRHYWLLGRRAKAGRQEWLKECIDTVEHLYNCSSIAVWVPFNEGWGQFDAIKVEQLIRDVDKTRLIDHASGWFDQQGGDFRSVHNYFGNLKVEVSDRAYVLSEFGGYACYIPGHSFSNRRYGYRIYINRSDLNKAYQSLFREEIQPLIDQGLSAAVYTQLSDVEDEVNGLLTYDRKVCKVSRIDDIGNE